MSTDRILHDAAKVHCSASDNFHEMVGDEGLEPPIDCV